MFTAIASVYAKMADDAAANKLGYVEFLVGLIDTLALTYLFRALPQR